MDLSLHVMIYLIVVFSEFDILGGAFLNDYEEEEVQVECFLSLILEISCFYIP